MWTKRRGIDSRCLSVVKGTGIFEGTRDPLWSDAGLGEVCAAEQECAMNFT
ncbi:MAG: hypothetical protein ACI841_001877 [Planctomycetota bacterium]|jgi:hypothetical protein